MVKPIKVSTQMVSWTPPGPPLLEKDSCKINPVNNAQNHECSQFLEEEGLDKPKATTIAVGMWTTFNEGRTLPHTSTVVSHVA